LINFILFRKGGKPILKANKASENLLNVDDDENEFEETENYKGKYNDDDFM
jgi:hypothetical protein